MHALHRGATVRWRPQPVFAQKLGPHLQRQRPVELALHGALALVLVELPVYARRRPPAGAAPPRLAGRNADGGGLSPAPAAVRGYYLDLPVESR